MLSSGISIIVLKSGTVADADTRSQRKEKTPVHSAESSAEEAGEDQSDTNLSTVTDLSDTRKQLEEELGDAALNSGSADKEKEGIKRENIKGFIFLPNPVPGSEQPVVN